MSSEISADENKKSFGKR